MPAKVELDQIGSIDLLEASVPETKAKLEAFAEEKKKAGINVVIIDFTHPTAVNSNADLYNSLKIPFVMGTTGGVRIYIYIVQANEIKIVLTTTTTTRIVSYF